MAGFTYHLHNSSLQRSRLSRCCLGLCWNRCHVQRLEVTMPFEGGLAWPGNRARGSWSGWLYLLRAEKERLNADQHTRYTGSIQGPWKRTRLTSRSGYVTQFEWKWMRRLHVHAEETLRCTSGARAATRQHTVNPKTLAPVLPSGCVGIFRLSRWIHVGSVINVQLDVDISSLQRLWRGGQRWYLFPYFNDACTVHLYVLQLYVPLQVKEINVHVLWWTCVHGSFCRKTRLGKGLSRNEL